MLATSEPIDVDDSTGAPPMHAAPFTYAFWHYTVVGSVTEQPPK